MEPSKQIQLTRKQLYEKVWSEPVSRLAPGFGLSDVGLAKLCKRYDIPRPPLGYWAKVAHGKRVSKPKLPDAREGVGEVIVLRASSPKEPIREGPAPFFDRVLGTLAEELASDRFVRAVAKDLRGCHPVTRQTKEALQAGGRTPTRDRYGVPQTLSRFSQPHVFVNVSREQRPRALLLVDALVKTFLDIGCVLQAPKEEWNRIVGFKLRELSFRLHIRERTRRVDHVLTEEERAMKRQYLSFAPKHDYVHTGDLIVEVLSGQGRSVYFSIKDGKRSGPVEQRVSDVAMGVLRAADKELWRDQMRKIREEEQREFQRQARERAEQERLEEERRQAELACRARLFGLAEDWRMASLLSAFLEEVEARQRQEHHEGLDADLLDRWLAWGKRVVADKDPFAFGLPSLPELTHPGIREAERQRRDEAGHHPSQAVREEEK